jgi:glucosamine 6-phosphate synthetase-like amidotransferase/phosphosugar isomerase protein
MCGVFGFVSHKGGKPNLKTLQRIALATERRGPHAFGFAWIDRRRRIKCYKQTARVSDRLGLLGLAADARMLIGHCRFATQGSPADNINNHPHPADGGSIVHNGQVRDYRRLVDAYDLYPVSACDSEVLGLLVEQGQGSILDRCRAAVRAVSPEPEPGTLFAAP